MAVEFVLIVVIQNVEANMNNNKNYKKSIYCKFGFHTYTRWIHYDWTNNIYEKNIV